MGRASSRSWVRVSLCPPSMISLIQLALELMAQSSPPKTPQSKMKTIIWLLSRKLKRLLSTKCSRFELSVSSKSCDCSTMRTSSRSRASCSQSPCKTSTNFMLSLTSWRQIWLKSSNRTKPSAMNTSNSSSTKSCVGSSTSTRVVFCTVISSHATFWSTATVISVSVILDSLAPTLRP